MADINKNDIFEADLSKPLKDLNKDLEESLAIMKQVTIEANKFNKSLSGSGAKQSATNTKKLTEEQKKAIKALRDEYAKLLSDINKQIEALDVKEAGPFAGVLLKANLAAREIEAQGEKAVDLAKKLGKSKAEIDAYVAQFKNGGQS